MKLNTELTAPQVLYGFCTTLDRNHLHNLKSIGVVAKVTFNAKVADLPMMLRTCGRGSLLFTTDLAVLHACLATMGTFDKEVTLDNYAGSIVTYTGGYEILVLNSLQHFVTVESARFLFSRYITKLTDPKRWFAFPSFTWSLSNTPALQAEAITFLSACHYQAWDIETTGKDLGIDCVGVAGISNDGTVKSYCFPFSDMATVQTLRTLAATSSEKIMQNGQFDAAYLMRFGIVLRNWYWDTKNLFHCWHAELPRSLGFIAPFMLRNVYYWKNEGHSGNKMDYYRYNARDCWATLGTFLAAVHEVPDWALRNYGIEFPLVYPSLLCGLTGIKADQAALEKARPVQEALLANELSRLQTMTGNKNFNPASPKQVANIFAALKIDSSAGTGKAELIVAATKHPVMDRIATSLLAYRKAAKQISQYLYPDLLHGRVHYMLDPSGTETGRLASKTSQFSFDEHYGTGRKPSWRNYGLQIQNIPKYAKTFMKASDGWVMAEIDNEQSESRCTAYLSQDENLIAAVEGERDFHCVNAAAFFGLDYDFIKADDIAGKASGTFSLRDLSKRVNHGANYNMFAGILIATMGTEKILLAKKLLKLPDSYTVKDVAVHLLIAFCKTYPRIKGVEYTRLGHQYGRMSEAVARLAGTWYGEICTEIEDTGLLTGATGWTRYCFGKPRENKQHLNRYVAHVPQSLSVMIVNRGFLRVYKDIKLRESGCFRLLAQVHDSILFEYKHGEDWVIPYCQNLLEENVTVNNRTLRIPTDAPKRGTTHWGKDEANSLAIAN